MTLRYLTDDATVAVIADMTHAQFRIVDRAITDLAGELHDDEDATVDDIARMADIRPEQVRYVLDLLVPWGTRS